MVGWLSLWISGVEVLLNSVIGENPVTGTDSSDNILSLQTCRRGENLVPLSFTRLCSIFTEVTILLTVLDNVGLVACALYVRVVSFKVEEGSVSNVDLFV